jgi:hypothetical protein
MISFQPIQPGCGTANPPDIVGTMSASPTRPTLLQHIGYSYGRRLPDSMRDWVREDLAGRGAPARMVLIAAVPCLLLLAPLLLIPTTLYVHASMTLPILIPFLYFSVALNRIWRRHRLVQHGLDPALADERLRASQDAQRRAYEARYGPRG